MTLHPDSTLGLVSSSISDRLGKLLVHNISTWSLYLNIAIFLQTQTNPKCNFNAASISTIISLFKLFNTSPEIRCLEIVRTCCACTLEGFVKPLISGLSRTSKG